MTDWYFSNTITDTNIWFEHYIKKIMARLCYVRLKKWNEKEKKIFPQEDSIHQPLLLIADKAEI